MTTDRQYAEIERRRGKPLTLAERNIDIAKLNTDLRDGKEKFREAVAAEQQRAIRRWQRGGMRGKVRLKVTAEMTGLIEELYATGREHGQQELRKAGYTGYADAGPSKRKARELAARLKSMLAGVSFRVNKTASNLDLSALTARAIADALSRVPGALDVAGRMVSPSLYAGLGAAFDQASGQVDGSGGGGNGWEYTAVMDGGTCDPCSEADGTTYATWDDAQQDLPDGGPNPDCLGETRCRCRLAPVPL